MYFGEVFGVSQWQCVCATMVVTTAVL